MMEVHPHWFKADGKYIIKDRGVLFSGPSPWSFDKSEPGWMDKFTKVPWVISHPEARKDCFYRVKGVESWALQVIHAGSPIGLLVEEIP